MGLGPNSGSRIYASLNNQPQGESVLDRTFRRYLNPPSWHFLTVLLGRSNDPAELYLGDITVGEVLQGLESITNQPRVPVTILQTLDSEYQHWQVLLDEDGIIGPDGQPILGKTGVQSTSNPNQLTAIFDTGFSFPQVPSCVKHMSTFPSVAFICSRHHRCPFINQKIVCLKREVSDAIYSGIPGASLQEVDGFGVLWFIPCDAEIDIAFKIGGQTYPVHPLDTNAVFRTNSDGQTCVGAVRLVLVKLISHPKPRFQFQPISSAQSSTYDLILGMAFRKFCDS